MQIPMSNPDYSAPKPDLASYTLAVFLRSFIALAIPFLLLLIGARLLMTPLFFTLEYNRADFPGDFYGFTREDRLRYAPYATEYLINGADIDYLGRLTFPDGSPLFNPRELHHMRDVKAVTQAAFLYAAVIGALALASAFVLWRVSRRDLKLGLRGGALVTLGLIAAVVIGAILSWDTFFTDFHQLFFAQGTWQFLYSDTLIRLFPEQFWFDAALGIGTFAGLCALTLLIASYRWRGLTANPTSNQFR